MFVILHLLLVFHLWLNIYLTAGKSFASRTEETQFLSVSESKNVHLTDTSSWTETGTVREWFNLAVSANGKYVFATVINGTIFRSTDFGVSFDNRITPCSICSQIYYNDLSCSSTGQIVALAIWFSGVFISTDFGVSFTKASGASPFYDGCVVSGDGNYIYTVWRTVGIIWSTDQGVTWPNGNTFPQKLPPGNMIKCSYAGQYVLVAGYEGGAMVSNNFGTSFTMNWLGVSSGVSASGSGQFISNFALCICVSSSGKYMSLLRTNGVHYLSSDFGVSWITYTSTSLFSAVDVDDSGQLMVAVANGTVILSDTFGQTWYTSSIPKKSVPWQAIATDSARLLTVAGSDGDTMAFVQLSVSPSPAPSALPSPTPTVALSIAQSSGMWTSLNLSQLWTNAGATSSSGQYVFVATSEATSTLSFSSDFGTTWRSDSRASSKAASFLYCSGSGQYVIVVVWDASVGYLSYLSSDFSSSFQSVSSAYFLGAALSFSGQYMFISATTSQISSDFGVTWTTTSAYRGFQVACSSSGLYVAAVAFSDSCIIGVQVSSDYGSSFVLRSTANGLPFDCASNSFKYDVFMSSDGRLLNLVNNEAVTRYLSTDFGASFTAYTSSLQTQMVRASASGQFMAGKSPQSVAIFDALYFSDDFGATWYQTESPIGAWQFLVMDAYRAHVYAAPMGDALTLYQIPISSMNTTSAAPSILPTLFPTLVPSMCPSIMPTLQPSLKPSVLPSSQPSNQPTSLPSAQPTSTPSCGMGFERASGGCFPCEPGSFSDMAGSGCVLCPTGSFSDRAGAKDCLSCKYPHTSVWEGQTSCEAFNLQFGLTKTIGIICALVVVVLLALILGENRVAMMLNLVYPTLDVFSDLAYLLTNDFYRPWLFYCGVVFLAFPLPCFLLTLREQRAWPSMWWKVRDIWWLSYGRDLDFVFYPKFPVFGESGRFPILSSSKHNKLRSLLLEGLTWVIAVVCQSATIILWMLVTVLNLIVLTLWLIISMFCHLTKIITLGVIWNGWFRVWTGGNEQDTDVDIDTEELNKCLQHEFYFETLPQFVLQLINNVYLGRLSWLAILSLAGSVYTALNGCWKFVYFRYCLDDAKDMRDIPLDKSIGIKIKWLGINWVLVNAKLEPKAKKKRRVHNERHIVPQSDVETNSPTRPGSENERNQLLSAENSPPTALEMTVISQHNTIKRGAVPDSLVDANIIVAHAVVMSIDDHLESDHNNNHNTSQFEDWLSAELRRNMTENQASMCVLALMREGITSQHILSHLPEGEFTKEYLSGIGITGLGVQVKVMLVFQKLKQNGVMTFEV